MIGSECLEELKAMIKIKFIECVKKGEIKSFDVSDGDPWDTFEIEYNDSSKITLKLKLEEN